MQQADVLASLLIKGHITVTTAESATAGMIASLLADTPGMSECMGEAYVTYSEDAKKKLLGVKQETLDKYTVYSHEVAAEMAEGARKASGADLALSVTGVAGPGGGTSECPVGTCYVGASYKGNVITRKYVFSGDRRSVRRKAARMAITLGIAIILDEKEKI
ncbi:MAG: CinA family protein [Lachnospiraceae bacterium]|uniref:CinA family protein n=1 Tax=Candidatus Weimeria bifida TaxID=2599074 RepID=A0A6N7J1P9_9FIRM|nr:CinA family protein [Candidatus Weimeria bifida]RRF96967.1 MAG: CinA family protein [Lachnospiraceae bacterium]